MANLNSLFDFSDSYLEVDDWVIIDLNRETGSIHMYEDYELSAESFLAEVNTLPVIPSLRMPFPSVASAKELYEHTTSDQMKKSSTKAIKPNERVDKKKDYKDGKETGTHNCVRLLASSDGAPLKPQEKTAQRWAEIQRILTVSLGDYHNNEENLLSSNSLKTEKDPDSPKSVYFDLDSSSGKEGSESPHTDPDFVHSSDSTDIEWLLGNGMAGMKVSDSFLTVESKCISSVNKEADASANEHAEGTGETGDETHSGNNSTLEERQIGKRINRDERPKETKNITIAAGVTAAMIAAIWMLEMKYDLS